MVIAITKLAPGKLPKLSYKENLGTRISVWFGIACAIGFIFGGVTHAPVVTGVSVMGFVMSFAGIFIFSRIYGPERVDLEGCKTFADLSRLIAKGEVLAAT